MNRKLVNTQSGYLLGEDGKWFVLDTSDFVEAVAILESKRELAHWTLPFQPTEIALAPLLPRRFILVGLNYASHAQEIGAPLPNAPMFGPADGSAVAPNGAVVQRPHAYPDHVDYEGELAIVIAKDADAIAPDDADGVVLGVTPCLDISARDAQMNAMSSDNPMKGIAEAKSFPNFKPLGPEVLVTLGTSSLSGLDLSLKTSVNGQVRQTAMTSEMLFDIPTLVSVVSSSLPLRAGDVICTGTPAGVGFATQRFLQVGDVVELTLGELQPLQVSIA